jgi:hypothetical protein
MFTHISKLIAHMNLHSMHLRFPSVVVGRHDGSDKCSRLLDVRTSSCGSQEDFKRTGWKAEGMKRHDEQGSAYGGGGDVETHPVEL